MRSAASHTGSLTSSSMVVDAACAAVGAHRVRPPDPDGRPAGRPARAAADARPPGGDPHRRGRPRSGGRRRARRGRAADPGADRRRSPASSRSALWAQATVTNPVDLAGAGEQDVASYARGVQALLASDQVDGVLLTGYFGGYSTEQSNLTGAGAGRGPPDGRRGRRAGQAARRADDLPGQPASQVLRAAGIPVHRDVDRACTVLAGLVEPATAGLAEELPVPAPPVTDTSYDAARALFAAAGIALPGRGVGHSTPPGWRLRSTPVRPARSCSRRRVGCTSPRAVAWSSASPTGTTVRAAYADLVARLAPPAVSVEARPTSRTASS